MNNENPNCADGCEGCDQETWLRCHEVEVHDVQFEEVYADGYINNEGRDNPHD